MGYHLLQTIKMYHSFNIAKCFLIPFFVLKGTLPKGSKPVNRKPGDRESLKSGEAVLVACESPSQTTGRSTSATSSSFEPSSSSYENSTTATGNLVLFLFILSKNVMLLYLSYEVC